MRVLESLELFIYILFIYIINIRLLSDSPTGTTLSESQVFQRTLGNYL